MNNLSISLYGNDIPPEIKNRLPGLYDSCYTTQEYFEIYYDNQTPRYLTVSSDNSIVQIIFFIVDNDRLDILNRFCKIHIDYIHTISNYLFDVFREVKNISFNFIDTPIENIDLPSRFLGASEVYVIDLPESFETYKNTLGKRTLKNIKTKLNKLHKGFSDVSFVIFKGVDITRELTSKIVEMNHKRMLSKSKQSVIDNAQADKIFRFAQKYGMVSALYVNSSLIAGTVNYETGHNYFGHIISHDSNYNEFSPGLILRFLTIEEIIRNKGWRFDLGYGGYQHKLDLTAQGRRFVRFSVYRTNIDRLKDIAGLGEKVNYSIHKAKNLIIKHLGAYPYLKKTYRNFKKLMPLKVDPEDQR